MNELEQRLRRDAARLTGEVSPEVERAWRSRLSMREFHPSARWIPLPVWAIAGSAALVAVAVLALWVENSDSDTLQAPVDAGWAARRTQLASAVDPIPLEREAEALRRDLARVRAQAHEWLGIARSPLPQQAAEDV